MFKKFIIIFSSLFLSLYGDGASDITPSARTCPKLYGAYVTGEFIYWKARQEEQIYVAIAEFNTSTTEISRVLKPKELDFSYDPGFKVGLGGDLPFDGWDLYLNWTHYHAFPEASVSTVDPTIIAFFVRQFNVTTNFAGTSAKTSWDLMFNSLDFDWGRRFYLSQTLTVRPSFGVKAAWINQTFRSSLKGVEFLGTNTPLENESLKWINNFWGVGPYSSFEGKWTFAWGLGALGKVSGALFYGQFTQDRKYTLHLLDEQTLEITYLIGRTELKGHRIRPTLQMFVGLDWEWCLIKNWLSINLRAGYETQFFWSQVFNSPEASTSGDLTMDGFTFMGRLDF